MVETSFFTYFYNRLMNVFNISENQINWSTLFHPPSISTIKVSREFKKGDLLGWKKSSIFVIHLTMMTTIKSSKPHAEVIRLFLTGNKGFSRLQKGRFPARKLSIFAIHQAMHAFGAHWVRIIIGSQWKEMILGGRVC